MTTPNIAGVIFDLDGVLVDSEHHSCSATAELLTARGIEMTEADVRRLFLGKPFAAVFEHCRALGHELPASLAHEKEDLYFQKAERELRAFPGAREVVERLTVPRAIASSGSPRKVAFSLGVTKLDALFDVVCTTAEVKRGKPAPDLFLLAAQRLDMPAERCAVIEDARPGIEAARSAGCYAVGITTTLSRDELLSAGAHVVVDRLDELPRVIPGAFGP